jgi:hypothetical protein
MAALRVGELINHKVTTIIKCKLLIT